MKVRCVKCGKKYELEDSLSGEKVECECGYKWILSTKNEEENFYNKMENLDKNIHKSQENRFGGCFFVFILGIIFFAVCILIFSSFESNARTEAAKKEIEQIRRNTQVIEDRQEDSEAELLKLYFNEKFSELQKFRYDTDFHKIGFGIGGKYNTWMKQCEELGERAGKTLKNGKYFDLKACPGYMIQVAIEYMKSRGEETKYTLETVPEIKRTIDREKYLKELEAIEQQRKKQ